MRKSGEKSSMTVTEKRAHTPAAESPMDMFGFSNAVEPKSPLRNEKL